MRWIVGLPKKNQTKPHTNPPFQGPEHILHSFIRLRISLKDRGCTSIHSRQDGSHRSQLQAIFSKLALESIFWIFLFSNQEFYFESNQPRVSNYFQLYRWSTAQETFIFIYENFQLKKNKKYIDDKPCNEIFSQFSNTAWHLCLLLIAKKSLNKLCFP